jgi:ATP-dependent protease ClpP protease subunit
VAHIDGMAASAATYVALAADEVEMSDGAMFMIHNAWAFAFGNASELVETAALLEKIDANLLRDYQAKPGPAPNRSSSGWTTKRGSPRKKP